MRIRKLIAGLPATLQKSTAPVGKREIFDVVTEASDAGEHTLFVCMHTHLHNYHYDAKAAYDRGCRTFLSERGLALPPDASVLVTENTGAVLGILAARCHRHPAKHVKVIGITGTNGKTSTAYLTASILKNAGKRTGIITTDGIAYGSVLIPAATTVPNAADLHRTLRRMREAGVEYAVVEFSAYMLKHGAARGIPFAATLLTDLVPHHLNEHAYRTPEEYRRAKEALLCEKSALCILPAAISVPTPSATRTIRVGSPRHDTQNAHLQCKNGVDGIEFSAVIKGKAHTAFTAVPAEFAAGNAYCALLLATAMGTPLARAIRSLEALTVPCRMECIVNKNAKRVFLDSAYTGEELTRALTTLRTITKGRLSVLLGSVGGRAKERRAPLGKAALTHADFTYFTADDPDTEPINSILDDMLSDIPPTPFYTIIKDRQKAIQTAIMDTKEGDVLLILGKAESTQLTSEGKLPFFDRKIATDAAEAY